MRHQHVRLSTVLWILLLAFALTALSAGAAAPNATPTPQKGHGGPALTPGGHGISLEGGAVFADDFYDPSGGWQVWSAKESSAAYVPGGFVLTVNEDNWAAWSIQEAIPALVHFRAEVDAALLDGAPQSSFGLVARYADDQHLYAFEITGHGYYRVTKAGDNGLTTLVKWSASPAIYPAPAINRLVVTCAGPELTFAANGQELVRLSDDSLESGQIGLIASRFKSTRADAVRVMFSNLVVTLGTPAELAAEPAGPTEPLVRPTATGQVVLVQPTATARPAPPAPPPPPAAKPPRPAPQGFAGTWDTNFGEMTLWVYGRSVDGEYAFKNGIVLAALAADGRMIDGTWDQDPTHNPPNDAGGLRFYLSDDDQSWTGTWGYGIGEASYNNGGAWTGRRIPGAPVKPPPAWSAAPGALPGPDWCKATPVPGSYVVYFTYHNDQPIMCLLDKAGGPPLVPSAANPLTLKGPNPAPGDHIYLETDGPDKNRFFNLMWDCGTNPGAYSPCDFWSSSLWDLKTDIVVNQANQIGTLNLSWPDNWAGVRSGFEPRRYPGDPVFRLLIGAR